MVDKTKILIVEHDVADVELLEKELKRGGINYQAEVVRNEGGYNRALKNFMPDIILSDFTFPSFDGPLAFRIRQTMAPDTPFIFVTGTIGEENSIEFIKQGVTDYVLKDNLKPLNTKIWRALNEAKEKRIHKQAEKEIAASEMLYHSLFDNMQEGFAYCKMLYKDGVAYDFMYLDVNGAFEKITGLKNVSGENVSTVIPGFKESNPELMEVFGRVALTGKPKRIEVYLDSLQMWLDISVFSTEKGYFTAVFDLITEKKEAAEKLANSEKRFRAMIEKSADMISMGDTEGNLLYISPSLTTILGFTMEDYASRPAFEFIHPDDLNGMMEQLTGIMSTPGKALYCQQRMLHKNGTYRWCEGTITNMLHEPGVNALVSNFRDISEKKIAEQQQEFSKNNLAALINNTADLMWSVDRNYNLITANQAFDEAMVAAFGQIIASGSSMFSVPYPAELLDGFKQLYDKAFKGESFTEITHFVIPSESWLEVSYYPIRKGNEIIGTACHSRDITKDKLAERKLQQSEAQLNQAQAIAHLGSGKLDFATNIITLSDEGCRIFESELGQNQLTFEAWSSLVHPEDLPRVINILQDAQTAIADVSYDCRLILKNGTVRHIHSESKFELDAQGAPMGMYGVFQDITERKVAEEKLKQSEARLNEAQSIAHISNWEVDMVNGTYTWSDELYKIYGINKGDVTPSTKAMLSFVHPDDVEFAQNKIAEALATLTNSYTNFRIIRKDGALRYGYIEWKFELDKNNKPLRLYGILQDITERKETEQEIQELNATLKQAFDQQSGILNALPSSIALLNEKGTILAVNEAWENFGDRNNLRNANHCVGVNYLDVSGRATGKDKEDGEKMIKGILHVMEGGDNRFEMEYPCHAPKEKRWFSVQVRPLSPAKNSGVVVMHVNITTQKLAHNAIANMNSELEERVLLRTNELQEANKSLEAFSYSVSHDLRTPVRSVMGFAKLISRDHQASMDPKAKELFGYIEESGKRMNAIIDDLLTFAKWGKERLTLTEVDMTVLFNHVWKNTLLETAHHAVLQMQPLPPVQADKAMIRQVVINLISNAVKYSSKKEKPVVKVGFEETETEVVFHVSDNGAGFDMKNYARLFVAFQRLHGISDFEGTGIGLTLVRSIIEKHKGRVWAEAKEGEGATFWFSLPKGKGPEQAA